MEKEKGKTAVTKPPKKKITFNKSMLSFKKTNRLILKGLFRTWGKFQCLIKVE